MTPTAYTLANPLPAQGPTLLAIDLDAYQIVAADVSSRLSAGRSSSCAVRLGRGLSFSGEASWPASAI